MRWSQAVRRRLVPYSSAYVFDPGSARWTKTGGMATGRTSPAAALLPDGRVLVAGGGYYTGVPAGERIGCVELVSLHLPVADMWPGQAGHALATAELYDPASGTWSQTGSMRFARPGPMAVTLGDGRVLVVGSGMGWDNPGVERAAVVPEIYDPAAGGSRWPRPCRRWTLPSSNAWGCHPTWLHGSVGSSPWMGCSWHQAATRSWWGRHAVRYGGRREMERCRRTLVDGARAGRDENDECTVHMTHVGAATQRGSSSP